MKLPREKVRIPLRITTTLRIMKLTAILLTVACLQISAKTVSQTVSLQEKDARLETVFAKIEQQTGYHFFFKSHLLKAAQKVTIAVTNVPIKQALDECLKNQPFQYEIIEKSIVIGLKDLPAPTPDDPVTEVKGRVVSEKGEAVPFATIRINNGEPVATTDESGNFTIKEIKSGDKISISSIGFQAQQIVFKGEKFISAVLARSDSKLDEAIVIGYGVTSRRLNTGSVSKVTSEEIATQPVDNPLAALVGRVPGLLVTQTSGLNGAAFKVQLRGQNSLLQGSDPFFIVDGVPFAPGNNAINQLANAINIESGGISPFSLINPADIESIEVLKDADATAIYGSRGANGVILITTKKAKAGKLNVNANFYTGWGHISRSTKMMNTAQYVEMRKEAFRNDGLTPTAQNAPDLFLWDTARYTDLEDLLIGNTSRTNDLQVSVSGGSNTTQFMLGIGRHKETTVFPTDKGNGRTSLSLNLNHGTADKRFSLGLSINYSVGKNELPVSDPTNNLRIPPHIMLYDSVGNLNWEEGGFPFRNMFFENPLAIYQTNYTGRFRNLITSSTVSYKIFNWLTIRTNMGYSRLDGDEISSRPSTSIDPYSFGLPYGSFSNQKTESWIIEPQIELNNKVGEGRLTTLFGGTWQENISDGSSAQGTNYSSDILLGSISGAGNITASDFYSQYRYMAVFGRITYNLKDKYLMNLSARRDGSSRFGPADRFANFGAMGAAWIFSNEPFFQQTLPFVSFGKLRASYGITGNDQIGDYKYLDTWTAGYNTYQGQGILEASLLYNPEYSWEKNKKIEAAMELGFLKDRMYVSAGYYNNTSDNQLVNYTLPIQTGFYSVNKNINARIRNTGWEVQVVSKNITGVFNWETAFNISANRNKLVSFPDMDKTSYAKQYIIGMPVSARHVFHALGVNKDNGMYEFEDANKDGVVSEDNDWVGIMNPEIKFMGGFRNTFSYQNVEVSLFFDFRKQDGYSYHNNLFNVPAAQYYNQPAFVTDRWQRPGDNAPIQRYTASFDQVYISHLYQRSSDAGISDASFIRLKNVSLSYTFPTGRLTGIGLKHLTIFANAQNLFTLTSYKGGDPDVQNLTVLPPLRTIACGVQVKL